jgi:hypothetical protein
MGLEVGGWKQEQGENAYVKLPRPSVSDCGSGRRFGHNLFKVMEHVLRILQTGEVRIYPACADHSRALDSKRGRDGQNPGVFAVVLRKIDAQISVDLLDTIRKRIDQSTFSGELVSFVREQGKGKIQLLLCLPGVVQILR